MYIQDCDQYARSAAISYMNFYYGWMQGKAMYPRPFHIYEKVKEEYKEYCVAYTALGYQVLPPIFMDQ